MYGAVAPIPTAPRRRGGIRISQFIEKQNAFLSDEKLKIIGKIRKKEEEDPAKKDSIPHTNDKPVLGVEGEGVCVQFGLRDFNEGFILVGKGEKPVDCGKYVPLKICSHCGRPKLVKNTCGSHGSRTCPGCWRDWRVYHVKQIMKRVILKELFVAERKYKLPWTDIFTYVFGKNINWVKGWYKKSLRKGKLKDIDVKNIRWHRQKRWMHVVYSPDVQGGNLKDVKEYRKIGYQKMKELGIVGGQSVMHPWRIKKEAYEELDTDRIDEKEGWYKIRDLEDYQEYIKQGLHYHNIAFSDGLIDEGDSSEDIVKRVKDIYSLVQLRNTLWYQLSHTAIDVEGKLNPVIPWGDLHWNSFSPCVPDWVMDRVEELVDYFVADYKNQILEHFGSDFIKENTCSDCGGYDFISSRDVEKYLAENPSSKYLEALKKVSSWLEDGGIKGAPPSFTDLGFVEEYFKIDSQNCKPPPEDPEGVN